MLKNSAYKWPLIFAVLLHFLLFAFLFIKFRARIYRAATRPAVNIIKATAVSQRQIEKQIAQIQEEKRRKKEAELARIRKIREQKLAAERKRKQEQLRLARMKAEKERKLQAQKLARQKARQEKLLAQRKAGLEQELKLKKAAWQKAMQQQIAAEQQRMAAQARQIQSEVNKYKAMIIQAISQYWITPPNLAKGIYCQLLVHVAPGGEVLSIDLIRSSGNSALDRSAKTAVLKASPLPVPKDTALFDNFRSLRLTVRPEGGFLIPSL